ncbi:MAG: hypothetical protein Q8L47_03490 [bacterium]|nr:hypothetical protein [bacterium]
MAKNKKISTIEELAIIVQGGFSEIKSEISELRVDVNKQFHGLREEVYSIRLEVNEIRKNINNVAYRFDVEGLNRRLKKVEQKLGIQHED